MERKRDGVILFGIAIILAAVVPISRPPLGMAADATEQEAAQKSESDIQHLQDVMVKEKAGAPGLEQIPTRTVIDVEQFTTIGAPTSVLDVLKTEAAIGFRGETDLDPGVDSFYLNGFDATRFVTAIDGLTISYGTYNTQNHELTIQGGVSAFTYDIAYRKYLTDGYLRNNETAIDTVFGRVGVVLPGDGFIAFSASYSDVDCQAPVLNPGQTMTDTDDIYSDYDGDYPEVTKSPWSPLQKPTWDTTSSAYRLNAEQSTPIGRMSLGAYASRDNRVRAYAVGIYTLPLTDDQSLS